jgi:transposase
MAETLRKWVHQGERDSGKRPGPTTTGPQRIKELEREVRELRKTNEILKLAAAYFAQAELDRHHERRTPSSTRIALVAGSSRSAQRCGSPRRRNAVRARRYRSLVSNVRSNRASRRARAGSSAVLRWRAAWCDRQGRFRKAARRLWPWPRCGIADAGSARMSVCLGSPGWC